MELQGKIKTISATELKGANNFKTRKIMLDRTSTYEGNTRVNFTEITLLGDKADLPEQQHLRPGDFVKCTFNVKGRFFHHEGQEKFAQDVEVWQISVLQRAAPAQNQTENQQNTQPNPYGQQS